jgi:hypothetical protein
MSAFGADIVKPLQKVIVTSAPKLCNCNNIYHWYSVFLQNSNRVTSVRPFRNPPTSVGIIWLFLETYTKFSKSLFWNSSYNAFY